MPVEPTLTVCLHILQGLCQDVALYILTESSQINKLCFTESFPPSSSTLRIQSHAYFLAPDGTCWLDPASPLKSSTFCPSPGPVYPCAGHLGFDPNYLLAYWLDGNWGQILGEGEGMACVLQGGNIFDLQIRGSSPLRGVCTISEVQRNIEIQDVSLL